MSEYRTEKDIIGDISVPKNAYYGGFTARALENFQISGISAPQEFIQALGQIKKSAAQTNMELGEITETEGKAIIQASDEFIEGKFNSEYKLDIFQAGAGTPFNMNANEIIANRANEILGKPKGEYNPITPNNHVNWGQSSNDVIPTAIRIATYQKHKELTKELAELISAFQKKELEFNDIIKIGRTHLQDAVPITLGQEFSAYKAGLQRALKYLEQNANQLLEVAIGGTAIGTGITAHPKYREKIINALKKETGLQLTPTPNTFELTQNMTVFAMFSDSLRCIADNLIQISRNLRLLASGPAGGLNEITLPEVEPGSSIMPGKVNPSIPECVEMVSFQIFGNDQTIKSATQHSELEINVNTPVIMHNLLTSINLLTNAYKMFREKCVTGIKANPEKCTETLEKSHSIATALSAKIGYKKTSEIVKESIENNELLKETLLRKNILTPEEIETTLSPRNLTQPG